MFSHFSFHFQRRWYNPSFTVQSNLGPSMYGMHWRTSFFPVCPSCEMDWSLLPTMKLGQGNIFRSVCQEFCPQWGLQAHTQGEGWGVWLGGSPGPHPGGSPGPHSYCCGWYTSYWNAFLFLHAFLIINAYYLCGALDNWSKINITLVSPTPVSICSY